LQIAIRTTLTVIAYSGRVLLSSHLTLLVSSNIQNSVGSILLVKTTLENMQCIERLRFLGV
jgi:hypothetical protein